MENKEENTELNHVTKNGFVPRESDTAGKSLSEAMEVSFKILKVIMIILVVAFLASGFKTVGPEEEAIVLRFGKIIEMNGKRTIGPGPHWIWPYPIDEIVKIPVARMNNLEINSFWYYLTEQERIPGAKPYEKSLNDPLNPLMDGYCLTRSEAHDGNDINNEGNDYNIVHTKWQLTYQIRNPELFFTNVQDPNVRPSDIYDDVIKRSTEPLLQSMFEDIVVTTLVNYTIDDAITSKDKIRGEVEESLQEKLDSIESGISIVSAQLIKSEVPRQVKNDFEATIIASNNRSDAITQAKTKAETLLTETVGSIKKAEDLYNALHDDTISAEEKELLWSQISGNLRTYLFNAEVYATEVAKNAEASAKYLQAILPEYRQRPDIVINRLYNDAMEKILSNAAEKFVVEPPKDNQNGELWISLNRDTSLGNRNNQQQSQNPQN
jgi:modulator of FtsH protease HflK